MAISGNLLERYALNGSRLSGSATVVAANPDRQVRVNYSTVVSRLSTDLIF
jgi:hypothetical protein